MNKGRDKDREREETKDIICSNRRKEEGRNREINKERERGGERGKGREKG